MGLVHDDSGAAGTVGFAIAGGIFAVIVGSLLVGVMDAGRDDGRVRDARAADDASSLLDVLVGSKGAGWEAGPDSVTQMGLLNQNGSGIDLAYIEAMQGAMMETSANGKMDYEEAMVLMGLDPDGPAGFHIRMTPVALDHVLVDYLDAVKTAYIGDWTNSVDFSVTVALASDAVMAADARDAIDADIELAAASERAALDQLGLDFDNRVHILDAGVIADLWPLPDLGLDLVVADPTQLLSGDVFPDEKNYLTAQLPTQLPGYDVLIIGSNVDHSSMTANAVKSAIEDFVLAGGALMVFGSDSQSFQWLQPIIGVGIETANQGAYATDVNHPMLHEPHSLDWGAYDSFDQAWSGNGGSDFDENFQHVLEDDDGDVLAVSLDGAYGTGRIFLSTFRPADIADQISVAEAMNLVNNMVVYSDRSHLFLDFGPTPPQDIPVGVSSHLTHVWDADLGFVPVRVSVLLWGT